MRFTTNVEQQLMEDEQKNQVQYSNRIRRMTFSYEKSAQCAVTRGRKNQETIIPISFEGTPSHFIT